jgi:diamine N-acetyltransferase
MLDGKNIKLRPATEKDRQKVFTWLAHSDLTPSMMGAPHYPHHPIPTWEEFCADYSEHYFDDTQPEKGRCFIIVRDGNDIGVVSYNVIRACGLTDMDIWLRSEADCGKNSGSDALNTLANYLNQQFGVKKIVISPSARNHRAIAAYSKAGFKLVPEMEYPQYIEKDDMEYEDNVVLVRNFA